VDRDGDGQPADTGCSDDGCGDQSGDFEAAHRSTPDHGEVGAPDRWRDKAGDVVGVEGLALDQLSR
jgi:hypothetical protein